MTEYTIRVFRKANGDWAAAITNRADYDDLVRDHNSVDALLHVVARLIADREREDHDRCKKETKP